MVWDTAIYLELDFSVPYKSIMALGVYAVEKTIFSIHQPSGTAFSRDISSTSQTR